MDHDDDLDALRDFRAEVRAPTPEASRRIADEVRARTGIDVGDRPGASGRARSVPGPRPDLDPDASELSYVGDASAAPPGGRRSRRAFLAVAAVAAAVVVVAALVLRPDGGVGQPTLSDLAAHAAQLDDRPLEPGEHQYSVVVVTGAPGSPPLRLEEWIAADDSGRSISTPLDAAGAPTDEPTDTDAGPGQLGLLPFSYRQLRGAPTEAAALRAALVELSAGEQGPDLLGEWTAGVLAWDVTPPAVRVGALDLLADLGYRPVGEVTDPAGRRGWGYALEVDDTEYVVVLDPSTDRTMAFATTTGDPADLRGAPTSRVWLEVAVRRAAGP